MMKLISHRGNLSRQDWQQENSPIYVDKALVHFEVEVDLWIIGNNFFLGHDAPIYEIDYRWLDERAHSLWIHCKNVYALEFCQSTFWHYFFHNADQYTLTSKRIPWGYPTATPIRNAIIAVPEMHYGRGEGTMNLIKSSLIAGICTDYPLEYQKLLNSP